MIFWYFDIQTKIFWYQNIPLTPSLKTRRDRSATPHYTWYNSSWPIDVYRSLDHGQYWFKKCSDSIWCQSISWTNADFPIDKYILYSFQNRWHNFVKKIITHIFYQHNKRINLGLRFQLHKSLQADILPNNNNLSIIFWCDIILYKYKKKQPSHTSLHMI